jgi:two-component system sensor histidine kinase DegS
MSDEIASPPSDLDGIVARLERDIAALERELGEVDLLVTQAKAEATRHEARRAQAAEKGTTLAGSGSADLKALVDLNTQLLTLTKRAALMESQVDILEGKRRALGRYRDALIGYASSLREIEAVESDGLARAGGSDADAPLSPALSKVILDAQEDLRREIARAMHDGPAQSLTNIVLQAQIVERLVKKDPEMAQGEVRQLVAMVQQTLDATKSFIFDVRPMVLDDLGLVPTLRRAARDRGRRAGIAVEFESLGQDRRLPMDLESCLFRILDEALAAYLAGGPERVALTMDWGERIEARVLAVTAGAAGPTADGAARASRSSSDESRASRRGKVVEEDLPPALAAMIEDRRADERDAAEAARRGALVTLPSSVWREIQQRASTTGLTVELGGEGTELRILAELPAVGGTALPG